MADETWQQSAADEQSGLPSRGTAVEIKSLVQELLKNGYIECSAETSKLDAIIRARREIDAILDPLDLRLELDELRGLAVLRIVESAGATPDEAWAHPLVRRHRLTLEQSLLVAILRQAHVVQEIESGIGVREVRVSLDDLLAQLHVFLSDTGSDAKNRQRLLTLLDQLKPHGIVSEPDVQGEVTIRPLITRLANPETLTALLAHFRGLHQAPPAPAKPPSDE
jgi:hypothetical protein